MRASWLLRTAILSAVVLVTAAGAVLWHYGSVGSALASLRGERYYCEPDRIHVGSMVPGSTGKVVVRVSNLSSQPLGLLGAHESCGCMVADGIPTTIPPLEARSIVVQVTAGDKEEYFEHSLTLYFDDPDRPEYRVSLHGRVISKGDSNRVENHN